MKVLVTGASGFIGRNLIASLHNLGYEVFAFDRESTEQELILYTKEADAVVHLAGINRPKNPSEFKEGNTDLTQQICDLLVQHQNQAPFVLSSSIQVSLDNAYGQSKRDAETIAKKHAVKNNSRIIIYRFSNLFGKWSRPNYNSVVATWCYNISRGLEVSLSDPNVTLTLEYIDDVVHELIRAINGNPNIDDEYIATVPVSHTVTLVELLNLIQSFKQSRIDLRIPDVADPLTRKLYSTYLSYLDINDFSYPLMTHSDNRGSFTEIFKNDHAGQVSVNISKPGITKGNHWHHSKIEKFLVVQGEGTFQFRHIITNEIIEYQINDKNMTVVDIPPGYTHNIINTGAIDLVTIIWVNEYYDPNNPDTYSMEV